MNCRKDIKEGVAFMLKQKEFDGAIKPNFSKIAREHNCDYRTVKRYFEAFKVSPKEVKKIPIPSKLDEFKSLILEKYDNGVPVTGIFMFLRKEREYKGSYSLITKFLRDSNREKNHLAIIRFETNPGKQAQVDWKECLHFKTLENNIIVFNIFLMTLCFSRRRFIVVKEARDQNTVLHCLTLAFDFFGGVPREILFDNMRSITDKSRTTYSEVIYNDKFMEYAKEAGFTPKNCIAYRACTKGKVESVARLVNRLKAYSGEIKTFSDIERITREFNEEVNNEICQATNKIPNELFKKEKEYLLPLTEENKVALMSFVEPSEKRKVSRESLFSYKGRKYSVSPKYIGKHIIIINDNGETFDITDEKGHFIKNQKFGDNVINYTHDDYMEISKNSSIKNWSVDDLEKHTKENFKVYDKLR